MTSNIQKRTRNKGRFSQNPQKTIEAQSQLFGCPGPRKLSRLSRYLKGVRQFKGYYQNNANFNALTGFHPLTRVPRNVRSDRQFVPYACCTFDFERLWPQPDAEGFRNMHAKARFRSTLTTIGVTMAGSSFLASRCSLTSLLRLDRKTSV